jgi:hypothetical protein
MPNYGLAPATPIAEMVRQMLRAMAWLYRNASANSASMRRRIAVAGHSAGAHLAAMMLAADWPLMGTRPACGTCCAARPAFPGCTTCNPWSACPLPAGRPPAG